MIGIFGILDKFNDYTQKHPNISAFSIVGVCLLYVYFGVFIVD